MLLQTGLTKEQKRIILLSSMGGMLEFYDFTIYGLFAVYFAHQFFPSHDNFAAIIASYSIFVVGYVVRPIGGIVFSHIGDEIGRKTVLILTMVLMGISSLGLGLLPTYAQIGIWAPILMLLLRILQGLAIGGELPSMIVYVSECIPDKRGIAMSSVFAGTVGGLLPGMLINMYITHHFTVEQINNFGWRIPFLLGGLLCFIAYQVRRKLHETTAFKNMDHGRGFPFGELLKHHLTKVLIGAGLISIMAMPIILLIIFMPTYLTKILKFSPADASSAVLCATLISVTSIYLIGFVADKFSPYKLMTSCSVLIVVAASLCYYMIANQCNLILALIPFAILQGALVGLPPVIISYLFPVQVRLTGVALSYNISFVLFGGVTPIVVTYFIEHTGHVYATPVLFLMFTSLLTLTALAFAKKYLPKNS